MESFSNVQEATRAAIIKGIANYKKAPKDRLTVSFIETRLEILEQHWQTLFNTHIEILRTVEQSEMFDSSYYKEGIYEEVEELYVDYKSMLKDNLAHLKTYSSKRHIEFNNVRLPEITIPTFSGNYLDWKPFRELFLGLVHKNKLLDATQKLYYLKSHLTGEAAELLRNVAVTAENYMSCWNKLEAMYNNQRYLANNILNRLLNQKCLASESAKDIKQLVNTTNDCLDALTNLGVDVSSWDILIVNIVSKKLDKNTRKAWELNISSEPTDELPTYEQFKQFLTGRYRCLENLDCNTDTEKDTKSSQPCQIQSFHVYSGCNKTPKVNSCLYCKSAHKIVHCTKFMKECNNYRRQFARDNGLCFICLYNNHTAKACKMHFRCHICNKQHHTLLHPSSELQSAGESSAGGGSGVTPEGSKKMLSSGVVKTRFKGNPGFDESSRNCVDFRTKAENKCKGVNNKFILTETNHNNIGKVTKEINELFIKERERRYN